MYVSNENNHLFLKAFLLFLIVFVFSTSADFNERGDVETTTKKELCSAVKQQSNANLISLPHLPVFKIKWSFGTENDFLFSQVHLTTASFAGKLSKLKYKLLLKKHIELKEKLKTQAFLTTLYKTNCTPLSYSA